MARPGLIVFDLDYTLWPFWVDTHHQAPFHRGQDGNVYDSHKRLVNIYPEAQSVLESLCKQGYVLGVASRTDDPDAARNLLFVLQWEHFFTYMEIYPGKKLNHFKRFQEQTQLPYSRMLFFDDEYRNIRDCSQIGVTCTHVTEGITHQLLQQGMAQFLENSNRSY